MFAVITRSFQCPTDTRPLLDPQTGFVLLVGWAVALAATLT
jgi:hypothetical protein